MIAAMDRAETYPMIKRAYTRCRFGQVHYRIAGERAADRPTLIMLHQNPASGWEYEPLMAALADRCHVIAFDTPGYGMSDAPPAPLSIPGYAEAFADAIAALEADGTIDGPYDFYGYHSGALHAIELALQVPQKARRLALTGIPMYPPEKRAELLDKALTMPRPDESGSVALGLLSDMWDFIVVKRNRKASLEYAVRAFSDKTFALDRMQWVYQGVWAYDYDRLKRLKNPVLLLQPDELLRDASLAGATLLSDVTICEMPELDREIFEIAPERLADELYDFLA